MLKETIEEIITELQSRDIIKDDELTKGEVHSVITNAMNNSGIIEKFRLKTAIKAYVDSVVHPSKDIIRIMSLKKNNIDVDAIIELQHLIVSDRVEALNVHEHHDFIFETLYKELDKRFEHEKQVVEDVKLGGLKELFKHFGLEGMEDMLDKEVLEHLNKQLDEIIKK